MSSCPQWICCWTRYNSSGSIVVRLGFPAALGYQTAVKLRHRFLEDQQQVTSPNQSHLPRFLHTRSRMDWPRLLPIGNRRSTRLQCTWLLVCMCILQLIRCRFSGCLIQPPARRQELRAARLGTSYSRARLTNRWQRPLPQLRLEKVWARFSAWVDSKLD